MAHEVLMPKLSSTMAEGTITVWLKEEGDSVEIGEAIFEVMTDKIAIEVEAYEEGTLLKRYIGDGESAPVNAVIAYIGEAGESVPEEMPRVSGGERSAEEEAPSADTPKTDSEAMKSETSQPTEGKIRATPAARRAAREKGVDLKNVTGSGPKGRIQALDVQNYQVQAEPLKEYAGTGRFSKAAAVLPWQGMRKTIADRMLISKQTVPHVTMNAAVDMSAAVKLREQLLPMIENQTGYRLSYTEIIMKAAMVALREFPVFNAHVKEDGIHLFETVQLGIAVAVTEGLVVPVISNAHQLGLGQLTKQTKELTQKARDGNLTGEDMEGGTFTISSLGASKVQTFNPIIHVPEAAILGVGGMNEAWEMRSVDGIEHPIKVPALHLSLSFDHRAADGAPAAAFLSRIVELLENPMGLLL
ncbi:2-oxo acid dehydrogenase subunit E2 [Enterococcus sp. BWT-B8]|uniref:dihydrolipoamide acetyltransferase family protein n=1 Tax=Enterococcus sp. BWT-B8 TaxID=2885157 RepID=UPI001E531BCC|nr:dihydrolipoamide acetyltransferase family protein [Enterococcus sp. BWT-B8]MCB5951437.1 2-oxo acid dehydrogenase subunit E2 [Enterococcus sp. BWT-B8]